MSMTSSEKSLEISLFGQTTKQPWSNFDPWKSLKKQAFWGAGTQLLL